MTERTNKVTYRQEKGDHGDKEKSKIEKIASASWSSNTAP